MHVHGEFDGEFHGESRALIISRFSPKKIIKSPRWQGGQRTACSDKINTLIHAIYL